MSTKEMTTKPLPLSLLDVKIPQL